MVDPEFRLGHERRLQLKRGGREKASGERGVSLAPGATVIDGAALVSGAFDVGRARGQVALGGVAANPPEHIRVEARRTDAEQVRVCSLAESGEQALDLVVASEADLVNDAEIEVEPFERAQPRRLRPQP